jgi:DNA-binding transcriptional LysR family regulator
MKHLRTLEYISSISRTGSIRRTAEQMNITPSALTRKIQDFEAELGAPVFERLPQGMRLNAAGELLVRHIRSQFADFERLRSQIADLTGVRRGHVAIACSQAFMDHLLPEEIAAYRRQFPLVSFGVQTRDHAQGIQSLVSFEADLALLVNPPAAAEMTVLMSGSYPLCAVMNRDHPLAGSDPVRLRECLQYPVAMPDRSLAIRHVLDAAFLRSQVAADVAIESGSIEFLRNFTLREQVISFHVALAGQLGEGLCLRPLEPKDVPLLALVLGYARGRSLPIAASKFAEQLSRRLAADSAG